MSGMMPAPGFLEKIRELCDNYGIVMVMDEVKTGFRVANGGAQEYFGIQGDLVTYAKGLGNGFPIAAIAGKNAVMMTIEPGLMAHGGTYSGNVVGVTAAEATLAFLEEASVLDSIFEQGETLMDGIEDILSANEMPHCLSGVPSMFGILLGTEEVPSDYRAYKASVDGELYQRLFVELVRRGVMPDPAVEEPWYLCYEHGDREVEQTLSAFEGAVEAAKAAC
jgi:glutamate-1-semialdehyde 2,1-aminomutase